MDVERAMCQKALQEGRVLALTSNGVLPEHFIDPEVAAVFSFAADYVQQYGTTPSLSWVQERFPSWRGEVSYEPIEALCDEFLDEVRRRMFESKILEMSELPQHPDYKLMRRRLDEVVLDAARELAASVPSGRVSTFSAGMEAMVEKYEDERGRYRPGTPLGIPVIDQVTDGIKPGWLVTTAGFSGFGKSFLVGYSLLSAFENDKVGLVLSLEMSREEVIDRLMTMVMHWSHRQFMRRELSNTQIQEWRDVARVYRKAAGEIIVLDKLGGCSLDRVHAEIERYKPDVCAVDYVQRMRLDYGSRKPKWEQLEDITNDLKTVAMDTDTAIIMASQDGRSAAETGSTATNMGGSISVYQAADIYLGLMQDEAMKAMNKMRIKMLKFRHGPLAEVDVVWSPETGDFGRLYQDSDQFNRSPVLT